MADTSGSTVQRRGAAELIDDGVGGVQVTLPPQLTSVASARHLVAARWPDLSGEILSDIEVVVAELVANAVEHGRPAIELHLRAEPFAINVAVLDHEPRMPATATDLPDQRSGSGRGLFMVDRLSRQWGVEPLDDGTGKVVWASIAT